ncbi:MAG: trigger factor [Acidobacteria bacterium]|nr:trigger factor [Acidobacteriota bacterium]
MKIELEDLSQVRKKLTVEIPQEETQRVYEEVSKRIASVARIPGFRPGRAPMGLVRSRFKNEIKDELIHDLLPKSYDEAVKSRDLKPLALPQIQKLEFQPGQPLHYEAVFEVRPEFQLGSYRALSLQKKVSPVTAEEVDAVVARLREGLAKFVPVDGDGRPTRSGDQLSIDIEGTYIEKGTGQPAADASLNEQAVSLALDDAGTLPEFNDSLKGAAVGETREFTASYPDDFARKDLAGKSVRYRVTVRAVKEKILPELNDEFARELGLACDTLEQVYTKVRQDLEHQREHQMQNSLQEQAVDQLLERNPFEVPEVLIEERVEQKLQQVAYDLARRGLDISRGGVNWQKIREEMRQASEREVRAALILHRVAAAERLEPDEDEVDQELERIAKARGETLEKVALQYEKENRMEQLRDRVKSRKAMRWLLDQADIQEVSP